MSLRDLLSETFLSLSQNKARSGLTILGIVVGIASVVLLVAIGQGSQASIRQSIQSAGANLVMVRPGFGGGGGFIRGARGQAQTLTEADAQAVAKLPSVVAVAPEQSSNQTVVYKDSNTETQITGTDSKYPQVRNVQMSLGSFLSDRDVSEVAKVAVLGPTTRDDLFGTNADAVGKIVRINGLDFTVIGVTKSKGTGGFGNSDDAVFVPLSTAQLYLGGDQFLNLIDVQAQSESVMTSLEQAVSSLLLQRHHISDSTQADFSVLSSADILSTATTVTGTFTTLLASIAAISLLVGGIGIMNMMLTTVTERTREIGLRKAIGARRQDISQQFLAESIALCVTGGVVGIVAGWGLSLVAKSLLGLSPQVSLGSVILAVGVCSAIGLVFGYYPARRAAGLSPMEALRYQ